MIELVLSQETHTTTLKLRTSRESIDDDRVSTTVKTIHLVMCSDLVPFFRNDTYTTVAKDRTEIANTLHQSTKKSEQGMAMAWKQVMTRKQPPPEDVLSSSARCSACASNLPRRRSWRSRR